MSTHTSRTRSGSRQKRVPTGAIALAVSVMLLTPLAASAVRGIQGPALAVAATRPAPAGTLGVGDRTAAPVDSPVTGAEKVPSDPAITTTALSKALAKKWAPVPKPKRVERAAAASSKRVATSTARAVAARPKAKAAKSTGGWRSARCSVYGIGDGLVGNRTASGIVLRADSMVVAHRSLAFGTRIEFEYRGRTCIATVADRGPFVGGRTFDLGPGTAKALGFGGVGTVRYRIVGR